jgi:vesicle transport through interaction with t-SNAREs protein 1
VEVEGELSEAEGFLRAMDVEFRTMSSQTKRSTQMKMTEYRDEYQQMIKEYQDSKLKGEDLVVRSGEGSRKKLIDANKSLDNSTAELEKSRQIIAHTEQTGNEVISDLEAQREKLVGANEYIKDTQQFTTDAKTILRNMGTRAFLQKIGVIFIIIALFAIIVVEIYYGFAKK